jgi:hypothetical protein
MQLELVMAGLDPATQLLLHANPKKWMPGTSPAMTVF